MNSGIANLKTKLLTLNKESGPGRFFLFPVFFNRGTISGMHKGYFSSDG